MDNVYASKHKKLGKGLFAAKGIKKSEPVVTFEGKKYYVSKCSKLPPSQRDTAIQTGARTWTASKLGQYINHSCNPTCGMKGSKTLIALRDIKKGEEITFDYSATYDSDWYMDCLCGTKGCRKTVKPWSELPKALQRKLLKKGVVSSWLRKKYGV